MPVAAFPSPLLEQLRTDRVYAPSAKATGPVLELKVPEGKRHNRLVDLGGMYRGKGLDAFEIETLLWEHATRYFDPPFSRDNAKDVKEVEDVVRWITAKPAGDAADVELLVHSTAELVALAAAAPVAQLIEPILPHAGNLLIYGASGVGKSHIGLCLALLLARGGSFLDWTVKAPTSVLYIDGEMPPAELKTRLDAYLAGESYPDQLRWIAARAQQRDGQYLDMPDLASAAGQAAYLAKISASTATVAVFDNLSTLRLTTPNAPENSVEAWLPIAAFIRLLNNRGIATIWIHHAAKSGTQRGSSSHTAPMDTVLCIRAVNPAQADPLAANDVEIDMSEKHRRFYGEAALPFRAKALEDIDNHVRWMRVGADPLAEDVARLRQQGLSVRAIASALERSKNGIQKALLRAKARGLLPLGGGDE